MTRPPRARAHAKAVALIGVLSRIAVQKALEPMLRLAATLDAIRVEALPERLDAGEMPRELAPVAETTEALMERVAAALARERRTTADIAHRRPHGPQPEG